MLYVQGTMRDLVHCGQSNDPPLRRRLVTHMYNRHSYSTSCIGPKSMSHRLATVHKQERRATGQKATLGQNVLQCITILLTCVTRLANKTGGTSTSSHSFYTRNSLRSRLTSKPSATGKARLSRVTHHANGSFLSTSTRYSSKSSEPG